MLLVVLVCIIADVPSAAESIFKFNEEVGAEVLRDDGGRIRGIRSRENKSFVLGGLFPVHLHSAAESRAGAPCGQVRLRGPQRVEAMLYAIDRINGDPELLPGIELGYDIRDTCLSETLGLDEAIDLIITGSDLNLAGCDVVQDTVASKSSTNETKYYVVPTFGIVGASGSRVSVPVATLGRLFTTPQVSYASTSPVLSDRTRYSYFRRTVPPDNLQVMAMIDILRRFGWNYVSILHSDDAYGSAGVNEFVNASAINGICIDLRRSISPSFMEKDYRMLLEDLGNSNANVVVLFANEDFVGGVLTRVHRNETLRRNFTWIASDGWAHSTDLVHRFNDTVVGLFGVAPHTEHFGEFDDYISQLTINSNTRNGWFPELLAVFANCSIEKDCDNNTNITSFFYEQDSFVPLVVDAVYAFAHALQDFLLDNCNSTDNAPYVWFKNNGTCFGQSRDLNGTTLLDYLSTVNFTSITSHSVAFDESGSVQGFYEILNYQATLSIDGDVTGYKFVSVGSWVNSNETQSLFLLDDVDFQYGFNSDKSLRTEPVQSQCGGCGPGTHVRKISGSCCATCERCLGMNFSSEPLAEECSSCLVEGEREMWGNSPFTGSNSCVLIPETSAMYSDPWAIPSLFFACVGLVCVTITSAIFGIYWKTPIVKSSDREQMILLLIGITCSFILPFFHVAPPSVPICLVNRLGIWFCYSLMFGALAIKAQRIARIFYGVKRNICYTPWFASPVYQITFTLVIVAVQMIPIIISLAFVHPGKMRILRYDQGHLGLPQVVVFCRKEGTPVLALSLLYETCIIAVTTFLGIFTFKFPKNFNEAKYISFCTFSLFVVWLGLIPAYFTNESRPEIQNATLSLFIVLSAFCVLIFIFGPKLFCVLFGSEQRLSSSVTTDNGNHVKPQSQGSQGQ